MNTRYLLIVMILCLCFTGLMAYTQQSTVIRTTENAANNSVVVVRDATEIATIEEFIERNEIKATSLEYLQNRLRKASEWNQQLREENAELRNALRIIRETVKELGTSVDFVPHPIVWRNE